MTTKGNVNYNEVIYLSNVFNSLPVMAIEKEVRPIIHQVKKDLSFTMNSFKEERDFIYLMNDGVEQTDQQGNKYLTEPSYQVRKEFTGSDEDYKKYLESTKKIKQTIFSALKDLGDKLTTYTLVPFLTEKQFDDLLEKIQTVDFDSFRDRLIKK